MERQIDPLDPLDREIAGEAEAAGRLEVIAKYVRRCVLCPLYRHRRQAVPGEGGSAASLVIVGEGPGASEDRAGRPFVGPAGELLNELLSAAGLSRTGAFVTNMVKCRPVAAADGRYKNRLPARMEVEACRPYLVRQLEIIRPRVILCLGATAARGLIAADFSLGEQHGRWQEGPGRARLIATFHPAFLLRHGGKQRSAPELRRLFERDLELVRESLSGS